MPAPFGSDPTRQQQGRLNRQRKSPRKEGFWLPGNVMDHEDGVRVLGDGFPLFRPMCGRFCTCNGLIINRVCDSGV